MFLQSRLIKYIRWSEVYKTMTCPMKMKCLEGLPTCDVCKADAEGYKRGLSEAAKFVMHMPNHPEKFSTTAASIIANSIRALAKEKLNDL
jgi:hypothetical protein